MTHAMHHTLVIKRVLKILTDGISEESERFLNDKINEAISVIPPDLIDVERQRLNDARQNAFNKSSLVARANEQLRVASNAGGANTMFFFKNYLFTHTRM